MRVPVFSPEPLPCALSAKAFARLLRCIRHQGVFARQLLISQAATMSPWSPGAAPLGAGAAEAGATLSLPAMPVAAAVVSAAAGAAGRELAPKTNTGAG